MDIGFKECSKCEYNLKCSECAAKGIHDNLNDILKANGRAAIAMFAARLKEELCKVAKFRDIHDEEECNMDSDDVWEVIERVAKEEIS